LEELYLMAHDVNLAAVFRLPLPQLRVLQIYHLTEYPLEILAENSSLAQLGHLRLHPHALIPGDEQAYVRLAGVRAVVNSPHLRNLSHLQLRLCDMGDEGCEEIVRSGILKRLKALDLMHGRVSDRGALALAACSDARNLELLDLTDNRLTVTGIAALQALGIRVLSGDQYSGDGEEYLYNGDIE
jgi:Ran GTPase-activating protein (RanGAP) involved in mRNA processing and transport